MTLQELIKAINNLPKRKSLGPDGIPAEVFQRITALRPYLLAVMNNMFRTGDIPEQLGLVYVIPSPKAGKDPKLPENKRPISLLNAMVKIMETAIYRRILPKIEP